MESFDERSLKQSLAQLEPWKRVAFMILICERLLPNYTLFCTATGFGNPRVLRLGIDLVWRWLDSDHVPEGIVQICKEVEQQAPDTVSFSSPLTSAALDAANAVAIMLDAIQTPETANGVEVASLARDTIDLYVQEKEELNPNAPEFEEAVRRHPLMQRELHCQKEDLAFLKCWIGGRAEAVRQLHARFWKATVGSLSVADIG